jgi:Concanavalin A-like lectin/glucanases superfamily
MIRQTLILLAVLTTAASGGLIHRYSFTNDAKDSVGHVDGKLVGGASISGGKLVLKNDGVNSGDDSVAYLEFSSSVLPKSGSVTLVAWFTCSEAGAFARVLNFGDKDNGQGEAFIYFTPRTSDDQSRAAITATDTSGRIYVDNDRLDDGKAHMVAVVVDDKTKLLHVFIDGKEPKAATDLADNTLDKVKPVYNWLGRSAFDSDAGFTGSIDEFRVYDTALGADEVSAVYKAGPDALP